MLERSTTQKADVQAILANVLDFSAYQILNLPTWDRLTAIIRSLDYIPLSLLYMKTPPGFNPMTGRSLSVNHWIPRIGRR